MTQIVLRCSRFQSSPPPPPFVDVADDAAETTIASSSLIRKICPLFLLRMLSPMCDLSTVVSGDLLRSILERLPPSDLARSACVCRLWRDFASDREMQEKIFRSPWKVRRVLGEPSSPAFWRYPSLDRFAISHRLSRGDSVAGLALRYGVQVLYFIGSLFVSFFRSSAGDLWSVNNRICVNPSVKSKEAFFSLTIETLISLLLS